VFSDLVERWLADRRPASRCRGDRTGVTQPSAWYPVGPATTRSARQHYSRALSSNLISSLPRISPQLISDAGIRIGADVAPTNVIHYTGTVRDSRSGRS